MARLQEGYFFDQRYKLLRKLGEGGYSEVWLVEDTLLREEVALKIFLPSAKLDDDSVEIFTNEFKLVYKLKHPNLLKYSYFGVCVGFPYLVMPYYNDGSVEDIIGKCNEQKAWQFLHDVSAGLACLHGKSIIHQDIKPANVLLDGSNFVITDFGISTSMSNLLENVNGTRYVQGTRSYMPPEKFSNSPQLIVENDIWSLGASLYELLTGRLPFGSRGGESQLSGQSYIPLPSGFSKELQSVIQRCLTVNPKSRPTAKELEKIAANRLSPNPNPKPITEPIPVPIPRPLISDPLPLTQKPEKNVFPWLMAAVGVVGLVVVLFVVWSILSREPEVIAPVDPPKEEIIAQDEPAQKKTDEPYIPTHKQGTKDNVKVQNETNSNNNNSRRDAHENLVPFEDNQLLMDDQHQSNTNLMY